MVNSDYKCLKEDKSQILFFILLSFIDLVKYISIYILDECIKYHKREIRAFYIILLVI